MNLPDRISGRYSPNRKSRWDLIAGRCGPTFPHPRRTSRFPCKRYVWYKKLRLGRQILHRRRSRQAHNLNRSCTRPFSTETDTVPQCAATAAAVCFPNGEIKCRRPSVKLLTAFTQQQSCVPGSKPAVLTTQTVSSLFCTSPGTEGRVQFVSIGQNRTENGCRRNQNRSHQQRSRAGIITLNSRSAEIRSTRPQPVCSFHMAHLCGPGATF